MSKKIKKLSKDIPFLQERGILKETQKFAEKNNIFYDKQIENMVLNAMIEIQREKDDLKSHLFTSNEIVDKLEKTNDLKEAIEYYKSNWETK